jgi:hypothetical protein
MPKTTASTSPRLDASVLTFQAAPHAKFWLPNGQLRKVVRTRLLKIADEYAAYLNLPKGVKIQDITFTGSLTGLNYTKHSDVDVHLILSYEDLGTGQDLATDFFDLKRKDWAATHPITVYGYPVELYAQDADQYKQDPAGHFSLLKNKWTHPVPEIEPEDLEDEEALALAREYADEARAILRERKPHAQLARIKAFIKRFKSLRQRGITSKAGIYSPENLAFKILRNSGSLDTLWTQQSELEAAELTLTETFHPMSATPLTGLLLTESQLPALRTALRARQTFLHECTALTNLLTEGELLEEGLGDKITAKLKSLLDTGGPALLRKSVLAAVMGGSLLLGSEAIAKAAAGAGLDQGHVATLQREVEQARAEADTADPALASQLKQLEQRYVIDNADASHTKQHLRFTGDVADVTGIGRNGYPLFKPGSASQQALEQAFSNPAVIKGTINMPGKDGKLKDFAGTFVKASGLYYVYNQGGGIQAAPAATVAPTAAAPEPAPAAVPTAKAPGYLFDFSGLFVQAKERFNFKKRPNGVVTDVVGGQQKSYTNFTDYAYDFVRQSGTGLEGYSNDQIDALFANGAKVHVPHLPGSAAAGNVAAR